MARSARESASAAWLVAMVVVVMVRVCVVVLLGVLSMRRAAVIGKSIPDGTNQLAPRSSRH